MSKPRKVKVDQISQVIPGPDGHTSEHNYAKGKVEIPTWAQCIWDLEEGASWSWNEDAYYHEANCPVCSATSSCTQNVTVWPRSKVVLVVHDYKPISPS